MSKPCDCCVKINQCLEPSDKFKKMYCDRGNVKTDLFYGYVGSIDHCHLCGIDTIFYRDRVKKELIVHNRMWLWLPWAICTPCFNFLDHRLADYSHEWDKKIMIEKYY